MSKSNAFEVDHLKLVFTGESIPGIADNASISPLTNLYIALHSSDPGEGGDQSTNEISYPGYARVAVPRTTSGWNVSESASSVSPRNIIEFGEVSDVSNGIATFASIGTAKTGTGKILYSGALTPTVPYQLGTIPRVRTSSTIVED